ncbi:MULTISPECIES: 4'-phosphopantetheinyl transferase superfamily protein [Paraburkholderia]|uniref:4'-phosphopantetheinyl transferase family protein n=1 Tax=Paraburkholderia TaxID=1822464 RepID=UPI002258E5A9|nr:MULTISPECIES: 4'-phosphopantetheinyl transferase superfamily protein [Paraburkholderia]MCX4165319.1 4'-phosphopantetheinyl transferase superfamily protein [Paraburkholderia megapolitana]MDN7160811.1 4'-phosphopantetheinyl transferase superfamily protein [Paraburkholderia sp. CHISQ3]MDQ6497858.1 4'-phosphopantetheinyl transferase superfamily protein [Paraburkholderia megapolitana]
MRLDPAIATRVAHADLPLDVELWRLDIPQDEAALLPMRHTLDAAELQRASQFHRLVDRACFIVTRHMLRALLAARTGEPAQALQFETNAHGKPSLRDYPTLAFNVSHSGNQALIALSAQRMVGVDIEKLDAALDWREISEVALSADEYTQVDSMPDDVQPQMFLRCWTAKEALLKATGLGIAVADVLRATTVDPRSDEVQCLQVRSLERAPQPLCFRWIDGRAGYVCCIAWGA